MSQSNETLPTSAGPGVFVLNDQIRWDLGKQAFAGHSEWDRVCEELKKHWVHLVADHPTDTRWKESAKEFYDKLRVDWRDVDEYGKDLLNKPDGDVHFAGFDPSNQLDRPTRGAAVKEFQKVYSKYVYRDHVIGRGRNMTGRQLGSGTGRVVHKAAAGNEEKLGPVIRDWGPRTKSWKDLALLWMKSVKLRYHEGQGVWRRDGKIIVEHIHDMFGAKHANGMSVIPEGQRSRFVEDYEGWLAQQEHGNEVVNRRGEVLTKAPKRIKDARDPNTQQFVTAADDGLKKRSYNDYHSALDDFIQNKDRLVAGKNDSKLMRPLDVRRQLDKDVEEAIGIRTDLGKARESQRLALKAKGEAETETETIKAVADGLLTENQQLEENNQQLTREKQLLKEDVAALLEESQALKIRSQWLDFVIQKEANRSAWLAHHHPEVTFPEILQDTEGNFTEDLPDYDACSYFNASSPDTGSSIHVSKKSVRGMVEGLKDEKEDVVKIKADPDADGC